MIIVLALTRVVLCMSDYNIRAMIAMCFSITIVLDNHDSKLTYEECKDCDMYGCLCIASCQKN